MNIKNKVKKLYHTLEVFWFSHLVYTNAPLVRALDATIGSNCKYCMASRGVMLGAGIGLANWVGVLFVLAALILTLFEKVATRS